jgi:hypothetical protein
MKTLLSIAVGYVVMTLALAASAQTCDVFYMMEVETADGYDVSSAENKVYGIPMEDVNDNLAKQKKVLSVASEQQDKGGPYNVELSEFRACNGGAKTKNDAGSILIKGATLKGINKIAREALRQSDLVTKRYEDRDAKGEKKGWDHSKAKKVKRDDVGRKVKSD